MGSYRYLISMRPRNKNMPKRNIPTRTNRTMDDSVTLMESHGKEMQPPTLINLFEAQSNDCTWTRAAFAISLQKSMFNFDAEGALVQTSTIDSGLQRLIPAALQSSILHLCHHSLLAGHPEEQQIYDTMRKSLHWPHMANVVYNKVARYMSWTRNLVISKKQRKIQLFPPEGPLNLVTIDIPGPLPKTEDWNKYIVVIVKRYYGLTKAIPIARMTVTKIAIIFMEYWVAGFGIRSTELTDNGFWATSKFYAVLCEELCVKIVASTEYHPQANEQLDYFNTTMVSRLRHSVTEPKKDWDPFLFLLTCVYSAHVHRTRSLFPFSLAISRKLPGPTAIARLMPPNVSEFDSPLAYRQCFIHGAAPLNKMAETNSKKAQALDKDDYDKHAWLGLCFATAHYVFVERLLLVSSAADDMAFWGYPKLLAASENHIGIFASGPSTPRSTKSISRTSFPSPE